MKANKAEARIEVFVPRGAEREDPNLFVGINGINYLLPRGKRSSVPQAVAREIERSERAKDVFYKSVDGMRSTGA